MLSDKRKRYVIRSLRKGETELLKDFLYEAIFIPEGTESPEPVKAANDVMPEAELELPYK